MHGPVCPINHNYNNTCVELCCGLLRFAYSNYCLKNLLEYIISVYLLKYSHITRMLQVHYNFARDQGVYHLFI